MSNPLLKHSRCSTVFSLSLACFCAVLVLASCSRKPSKAIVGKWNVVGASALVEFRKDGTLTSTEHGHRDAGTYKFTGDNHMQVSIGNNGTNDGVSFVCDVTIHDDMADFAMSMPNPGGEPAHTETVHLKRVK